MTTDACFQRFNWAGTPAGKDGKLANNASYVTGEGKDAAILIVHDIWGYSFPNTRLLADSLAKEVGATVYIPDFFNGEQVDEAKMKAGEFDVKAFIGRHNKETRFPEMEACAKALRSEHNFKKIGALGFCYGGWACFQLGAKGKDLVDCISVAHPSILTKEEMDGCGVPCQINAPENDGAFTPELKEYANKVLPTLNIPYDYQYYPGANHGFAIKCDENDAKAKADLERNKNAMAYWCHQFLKQ